MSRRLFVGGNWKSNGTRSSVSSLVSMLRGLTIPAHTDVCVCPTFIHLDLVRRELVETSIIIAAQNCSYNKNGAFTGEVSAEQLKDFGVHWTLIGHSERRQLFHTTDDIIQKQLILALTAQLKIICCVGETEQERKDDQTMTVISRQLEALLKGVESFTKQAQDSNFDWASHIVIAYEPVWAIGTGQTATSQQAQEVHHEIRQWLSKHLNDFAASNIRIIYGGSVQAKNAKELIAQPDIDGFLVGGASLKPEFGDIIAATES